MAQKYEIITKLYEQIQKSVAEPKAWRAFLASACRNYKLSFDEQLLVYAQCPGAIAVLELNDWNKKFGRWVNTGSTGIAVLDKDHIGKARLKYFFDIRDTHEGTRASKVPIWDIYQREKDIIEAVENSFGTLENSDDLGEALLSAAKNASQDNMQDYLLELMDCRDGSFLEELDAINVKVAYREALENSVAYMLLTRCGIDAESYFTEEDFRVVTSFNTVETLNALGTGTSDIAQMVLSEISRTALNLQRQTKKEIHTFAENNNKGYLYKEEINNQSEGSFENGTDIHESGRLQSAQPIAAAAVGADPWQIRPASQKLSAKSPQDSVHQPVNSREAAIPSFRDTSYSAEPHGRDDKGADAERGRNGGNEKSRPNEMGGADEQSQAGGSGGSFEGDNLQLIVKTEASGSILEPLASVSDKSTEQLSLYDFGGINTGINEGEGQNSFFAKFEISQQIIDEALCIGANDRESKLKICAYFMKDKKDNSAFLQEHYGTNGAGFYFGSRKISLWYDATGMRIADGDTAQRPGATLITWEQAAKRIGLLLDLGRYMPLEELNKVQELEQKNIAEGTLYICRDFEEAAVEANFVPSVRNIVKENGGFPAMLKAMIKLLKEPATLQVLIDEWKIFTKAHQENRELLRFYFYRPMKILGQLLDLQRVPLSFTAAMDYNPQGRFFITKDEIDEVLRGGKNQRDSRLAVYAFYLNNFEKSEREKFLKSKGEYSGSHSGNNNLSYQAGKGLTFSHGNITAPYAKVELKWSEVEKRISALIASEKYVSESDLAYIPSYKNNILAQHIFAFFYGMPQGIPHPYGEDHSKGVSLIEEQLSDRAKVSYLYEQMAPVWESTLQGDRYYESRKEAFEGICAYRGETYSLFGEKKEPVEIPQKQPEQEAPMPMPWYRQEATQFSVIHPEIIGEARHDFHITDTQLGIGLPREKYAANITAIRTLKQIEAEDRLATPKEQELLSKYIGWGGLADCFEEQNRNYGELKDILSETEYASARASTLTAFYTSPIITKFMYKALEQMGFAQGNILEPSCGVGNFMGMLPESLRNTKVYAVELDSISGRIASQLYQNSSVAVAGFEKVEMPDSFFDVAIGNVPFGDFKVLDKRYDKNHWLIHDYFFGKTLDKVRPGGIVAFITSKGTMDKDNSSVRKYLAQRAELIGAIRLPDNVFQKNAGTKVTSDIIFLQKRDRIIDIEPDWVHLDTAANLQNPDKAIKMNSYFVQNPHMILGEMVMESTRFGMDSACKAYENADLEQQLKEALNNLHGEISAYEVDEMEGDNSIPADSQVRNFSYATMQGKLYFRENSRMHPVEVSITAENRIRGMIQLRDCVRRLITYQTEDYPDEAIKKEQVKLNELYDNYVKTYDRIFTRANSLAFAEDASYCLLCSLEVLDEQGKFKQKAAMFTRRTIKPHIAVTSVDTASEALAVSMSEKAQVDMVFMSELSGKSVEDLEADLRGVIFRNITSVPNFEVGAESFSQVSQFDFVTADEYLSGNVRKKLQIARALEAVLPIEEKSRLHSNIAALETAQPTDLTAGEIGVRIGATWVPPEIYQQFMFEIFGTANVVKRRINILYAKCTGEWNVTNKTADYSNIKAITTYGTKRINAYQIFEQTLNLKDVRVFDTVYEDGNEKRVLNKRETAIAQDRQELIKTKFTEWIWKDINRREALCHLYNDTFNSIRPRSYSGEHIRFSGMNPEISLREHQLNAIAHIMYGGNTLLAHEVGAGKTYEIVAAAQESKRLGLCNKALIVVPNHITEQWAAEWLQLYPSANILVATKKDFEKQNRKKFCARISTGEYDAVIIGHSQFEKIPMSKERQEIILQNQIDEMIFGIQEAKKADAERYTIKQMERTKKALETRIAKLNDQSRKDNVVTFEELGVDRIFIDESHYYKNLFLMTKMRNVGGIAQTEAQKSSDLFMKCQYLDELTNNKGVVFATGTTV